MEVPEWEPDRSARQSGQQSWNDVVREAHWSVWSDGSAAEYADHLRYCDVCRGFEADALGRVA